MYDSIGILLFELIAGRVSFSKLNKLFQLNVGMQL